MVSAEHSPRTRLTVGVSLALASVAPLCSLEPFSFLSRAPSGHTECTSADTSRDEVNAERPYTEACGAQTVLWKRVGSLCTVVTSDVQTNSVWRSTSGAMALPF